MTEYPARKYTIKKLWRWPMKVCKMSVFINMHDSKDAHTCNMHDSKDAQDFRSLTCHVMWAFKNIFRLFFGIFYGGNKSMNFLSGLHCTSQPATVISRSFLIKIFKLSLSRVWNSSIKLSLTTFDHRERIFSVVRPSLAVDRWPYGLCLYM